MRVVLASGNPHKREEIAAIIQALGLPLTLVTPGVPLPDVVEDGDTLAANAIKKARTVALALGLPALADDTGLEVDALGGAPGHHAARYAGPEQDAAKNVAKLLAALRGVPAAQRTARFRCVMALVVDPRGEPLLGEGIVEGRIAEAPAGGGGFGYDPVFWLPESSCTLAALPQAEKNALSHRYRALADLGRRLPR
ncbi:RdgB/HAM1 family non-canonical purine NTP pyrophosphatase [bacterium]|nr:RdgB/HAM1 family non-canonical purine NTP pyrophosphatase [bacterium]